MPQGPDHDEANVGHDAHTPFFLKKKINNNTELTKLTEHLLLLLRDLTQVAARSKLLLFHLLPSLGDLLSLFQRFLHVLALSTHALSVQAPRQLGLLVVASAKCTLHKALLVAVFEGLDELATVWYR